MQSTPVETLVDMVSDRGSTPLASTIKSHNPNLFQIGEGFGFVLSGNRFQAAEQNSYMILLFSHF